MATKSLITRPKRPFSWVIFRQRWRGRFYRARRYIDRIWNPVWSSMRSAVPAMLIALVAYWQLDKHRAEFPFMDEFDKGRYLAGWGTLFDVVVAAIVLVVFDESRRRREQIERYIDEIDDFKKWDTEEARVKIAGNLRRLAKLRKTDIDCSGIILRGFSFPEQDIESIRGATFNSGLWTDRRSRNTTILEKVNFSEVDCRKVTFSRNIFDGAGLSLTGTDLTFYIANLTDARFDGAMLSWTDTKADEADWFEDYGPDEEGRPMSAQIYAPAFSGANLMRCSFRFAELKNADFREAINILEADFTAAKGLETCYFDEGILEKIKAKASS